MGAISQSFVGISCAGWQGVPKRPLGELIISEQEEDAAKARIDIGSLARGLYLLNIRTPKEQFNRKRIKQ